MFPVFKRDGTRIAYALCRRLYFVFFFSYFPCIFALAFISELSIGNNVLGFWLPFMFLSLFSLPFFVGLLLAGVFINHILCMTTGVFGKKAGMQGILFYSLTLLCLILTFISAVMYTGNILPYLSLFGVCAFCATAAILFVCAHAKLKREIQRSTPYQPDFEKKLSTYKNILTVAVIAALVLSFVFLELKI